MVYNTALSIHISHQMHAFIHKPLWVNLAASISVLLQSRNQLGDKKINGANLNLAQHFNV